MKALAGLAEWLFPDRFERGSVPPLEGGYRPNSRLDTARRLAHWTSEEPDGALIVDDDLFVSVGSTIVSIRPDGSTSVIADLGAPIDAIASAGDRGVIAAVRGIGVLQVDEAGIMDLKSDDVRLQRCVTDLDPLPDGSVLATIGSTGVSASQWVQDLVAQHPSGSVVRLRDGDVTVLAENLPWPAGVAADSEDSFVLALSHSHVIQRRQLGGRSTVEPFLTNIPGYPGRITKAAQGWWVAAPYLRNRATELFLSEPAFLEEMTTTMEPEAWLVPKLRTDNPIRETLQVGQRKVFGEIKPWATPQTYGLAFKVEPDARVSFSAHSRPDARRHGVTAVVEATDGSLVVVSRGAREVLSLEAT